MSARTPRFAGAGARAGRGPGLAAAAPPRQDLRNLEPICVAVRRVLEGGSLAPLTEVEGLALMTTVHELTRADGDDAMQRMALARIGLEVVGVLMTRTKLTTLAQRELDEHLKSAGALS